MKKWNRIFIGILSCSIFFVSCSSDDNATTGGEVSLGQYEDGVFVLNEGNSNVSSASVTFIGKNGTQENDVFTNVNPKAPKTGSYLQNMFFDDSRAYIVSGQANKITVVDRYTFKFIASIDSDFKNPRYGTISNGKAFVTNAGADWFSKSDDFLTVINLSNFSTSKLPMNNWCERITEENGKVYVANGYYESGTSITVVNAANNTIEKVIELGFSPNSMEEEDGILYVVGSGKLAKITLSNQTLTGTPMNLVADSKNLDIDNNTIYFTSNASVFGMPIEASVAPTTPIFTYQPNSVSGAMYGFAVNDGKIYIGDVGSFSSDSQINIYTLTGSLIDTKTVGVAPNGFYFY